MSELTPCNRCVLNAMMIGQAKASGKVITLRSISGQAGGVEALLHREGEQPCSDEHFATWFTELPDECCC